MFCDINRPIGIEFQEKLEQIYDADYYPVNFIDSTATIDRINAYVRQQTQGRIKRLLETIDLRMVHGAYAISFSDFLPGKMEGEILFEIILFTRSQKITMSFHCLGSVSSRRYTITSVLWWKRRTENSRRSNYVLERWLLTHICASTASRRHRITV